jgi:tight adherence protein B
MSTTPVAAALAGLLVVTVAARLRPRPPRRLPDRPPVDPIGRADLGTATGLAPRPERRRAPHGFRRRPAADEPAELAAWCDRLAHATRSGATLAGAVRATDPPTCPAVTVDAVVLALDRGAPLAVALDEAAGARPPNAHLALALTVLHACAMHGGPPAEPIDRAAAALRARAADLADRRTQSAQARLSAAVMTVLPVAMLVLLLVTSAPVRAAVVQPLGAVVLVLGAVLNVAGWRWMHRLIDGRTPA